jgi:hypothetical protein
LFARVEKAQNAAEKAKNDGHASAASHRRKLVRRVFVAHAGSRLLTERV